GCRKRAWTAAQDQLLMVHDGRDLAMHDPGRPAHRSAKRFPQTLMSQADSQRRERGAQLEQKVFADARLRRCSRSWRENRGDRVQPGDFRQRDLVVAPNDNLLSQLAKVLDEVVGERVVVVDYQDSVVGWHVSPRRPAPEAGPTLCSASPGILLRESNPRRSPPPPGRSRGHP